MQMGPFRIRESRGFGPRATGRTSPKAILERVWFECWHDLLSPSYYRYSARLRTQARYWGLVEDSCHGYGSNSRSGTGRMGHSNMEIRNDCRADRPGNVPSFPAWRCRPLDIRPDNVSAGASPIQGPDVLAAGVRDRRILDAVAGGHRGRGFSHGSVSSLWSRLL